MSKLISSLIRPSRSTTAHTDRSVWRTVPVVVETPFLPVPRCVADLLDA